MIKSLLFQQHHQQQLAMEENLSNLTSASGEASVCSGNRTDQNIATDYNSGSQQYFSTSTPPPPPPKKKRNLPGNPDPDSEVIALSPKSLLATNRFLCEICNKGFQRDQNLQLHRRGHNLPWKLKQRSKQEVIRRKVYVCPEESCVHHDPSRALGDLTGIKKHFSRKHGEKKWKCEKCSKKYAVQSDWKAHSKTCGTREYRCDCGTLFSRRDSFITHRAFCDALAEESARAITSNPIPLLLTNHHPPPSSSSSISHLNFQSHFNNPLDNIHSSFSLKKEHQNFTSLIRPEIPPWLAPSPIDLSSSSSSIYPTRLDQDFSQTTPQPPPPPPPQNNQTINNIPNPNLGPSLLPPSYLSSPSTHMSATALLQKAAQMGSTMSSNAAAVDRVSSQPALSTGTMVRPHNHDHMSDSTSCNFGLNLSSAREDHQIGHVGYRHEFPTTYQNNAPVSVPSVSVAATARTTTASGVSSSVHDLMNSFSSVSGFERSSFAGSEGMTRDFLGLRAFSHGDFLNIAGFGNCMNTAQSNQNQIQKPWQG